MAREPGTPDRTQDPHPDADLNPNRTERHFTKEERRRNHSGHKKPWSKHRSSAQLEKRKRNPEGRRRSSKAPPSALKERVTICIMVRNLARLHAMVEREGITMSWLGDQAIELLFEEKCKEDTLLRKLFEEKCAEWGVLT